MPWTIRTTEIGWYDIKSGPPGGVRVRVRPGTGVGKIDSLRQVLDLAGLERTL